MTVQLKGVLEQGGQWSNETNLWMNYACLESRIDRCEVHHIYASEQMGNMHNSTICPIRIASIVDTRKTYERYQLCTP